MSISLFSKSSALPHSSTVLLRQPPRARPICTTRPRQQTHYDALGVSNNASKMEIKSNYFRLSKKYHPDVADDPRAKDKFHRVSEAYSVLSNDRQRRAYDRELAGAVHRTTAYTAPQASGHWSQEYHERRRRGATHAWEHPRRSSSSHFSHHHYQHPRTSQHQHSEERSSSMGSQFQSESQTRAQGGHHDPYNSPYVRRSVGPERVDKFEQERREHDRLMKESAFGRFVRVLGLVVVVTLIGGGWSAHAV